MTLEEAIRTVLNELETNSLEVRPFRIDLWNEALRILKRELRRNEKWRRKVRRSS